MKLDISSEQAAELLVMLEAPGVRFTGARGRAARSLYRDVKARQAKPGPLMVDEAGKDLLRWLDAQFARPIAEELILGPLFDQVRTVEKKKG